MNSISFCINTARNELDHVKLLFKSLECNLSTTDHEIVVFIDSDNQGTFEWLLTQKSVFPNLRVLKNELPICYGYARNINEMFQFASNEIVSYLQSDMVVCKNYDQEILKHLKPNTILCSTRIEPPLHGNSGEKMTYDFGLDPTKFDLEKFTEYAEANKRDQLTEYFFAPFTLYKSVWNNIGGHDTMFRRSREDSDILTRLVLNDVAIVQTWSAIVYHFTCTSSRGSKWFDQSNHEAQARVKLQEEADRIELYRFTRRWGKFHHSTTKPKRYNISAAIRGLDLSLADFTAVECFFDRVYVDDSHIAQLTQETYDRQHSVANKLLNISPEDWLQYGYIYNQQRAADRVKPMQDSYSDDVIVSFELTKLTPQLFAEFVINLQDIIESTDDLGTFEYGPFQITINAKRDVASDFIKITNPQVKPEHKYTIH